VRERFTYANVVATLALFLALGGASYAAMTLAPNSVGTSQLRSGAVTGSKLAFPLGIATSESAGPVTLSTGSCSPQTACPATADLSPPLVSTSLDLTRASRVLVIGSAEFNLSSPNVTASVELGLQMANTKLPSGFQPIASTSATAISVERVLSVPAGRATLSLTAEAAGTNPGTLISGDDFQIAVIVLPAMRQAHGVIRSPTPVRVR
jgi:hypothetical protein